VKHIRPSDLRFKRRKNLYFHPTDEEAKQLKATAGTWLKRLLMRWHARHAAAMILNSISSTYQFGSYVGDANQQYIHVDADKTQLAHWILMEAGYECCPDDLKPFKGRYKSYVCGM